MAKRQKTQNMCELEKYAGEMTHKKFIFCEGFYLGTGIPFYDDYLGYEACTECKECKWYLYREQYVNLLSAVAISFAILLLLIFGTPQGAVRRSLFFNEGVREAFLSSVERIEQEGNTKNLRYSVIVNGEQQEWDVICLQQTCFAERLSK